MELFRVRLNCIDYYQSTPTKFDPILRNDIKTSQLSKEPKVPVIRIFGATETGQKVCAHVHGAFPYLYIEYNGDLNPEDVGAYIHRFHLSVDYALAVSYRRNPYDGNAKFVARITLVKGIPFYGFHVGYRYYLKLYMLNPMVMTRLADILRQGAVMKKVFQPYEAHLQYLLQWMADYNLFGCGYIDCIKAVFRSPVPELEMLDNFTHLWHDRSIPTELVSSESELPRVSHCPLEVDICVQDILNRKEIRARTLHHDFVERLNPIAPDEKLVHSMAGLWRDETRRRKSKLPNPSPGSDPFPPEVLISMSANLRESQPGGWIHEEEYREKVMSLIEEEKNKAGGETVSFESFVTHERFESSVKTTLDSVEDLYPENLRPALGLTSASTSGIIDYGTTDTGNREVDERRILGFSNSDEDDSPYNSDEEVMREMELLQRKKGDHAEADHLQIDDLGNAISELDGDYELEEKGYRSSLIDMDLDFRAPRGKSKDNSALVEPNAHFGSLQSADFHDPEPRDILSLKKRSESPLEPMELPAKRAKLPLEVLNDIELEHQANGNSKSDPVLFLGTGERERPVSRPHLLEEQSRMYEATPTASPLKSRLSQEKIKAAGASQSLTLKFPVVKDPHNPNTTLSLSNKATSRSNSPEKQKQVSFDPHLVSSQNRGSVNTSPSKGPFHNSSCRLSSSSISQVVKNMEEKFKSHNEGVILAFNIVPPSGNYVLLTMRDSNRPSMIYQDAFYSDETDVPPRAREWAGKEFKIESSSVPFLPDFDHTGCSEASLGQKPNIIIDRLGEEKASQVQQQNCTLQSWEIMDPPPTYGEVARWVGEKKERFLKNNKHRVESRLKTSPARKEKLYQIDGPTQKNKHGFKYTQNKKAANVKHETQYMSTMSLEVHINTRGNFVPNPEEDEVQCVYWCLQSDDPGLEDNGFIPGTRVGIIVLSEDGEMSKRIARQVAVEVQDETTELELLVRIVEIVRSLDPDILTGFEVHGGSWGYLIERARLKYEYNLCDEFSRMKSQSFGRSGKDNDQWGFNNTSTIRITGRHVINIWRAMRSELNLLQYTMENVVFHLLHRRIPHFTWADLTNWYINQKPRDLSKVINYYVNRVQLDLEILDQNELIPRTSEQARLLGVDFFSVFSRGSQFKVESLMFRIAKPENFLLVSPSRKQVGGQNALECLPLVMEPQSAFYNSPLLVLDFQSLYPSVMIAYNYCYSTFLGRVVNWRGTNKMGFTEYKRQQRLLELLKDHINISPNGMMYTKPDIRKSLLAKMLGEILETRVMVKSGMKVDKHDKSLQRLLNNRQLALKLIANVTYGYTSASFSGRMPCSEIADSIVQTGRETLEKAIALIHSVKKWGAEVVYGDTDSLFVYLNGRTKDEAFEIGEQISKTITDMNPRPIKLKFEKVYLPCVLLAKKRYVGFKYEGKNQTEPDFDAKGIETVRRDGTPAEQKIEEKALKILFRTADLSQVKTYFQKQCEKIMTGSISIQDFCFAKEVKLGTYSDKGPPPPGVLISTKRMLEDARAEPQYGERVPYVVIRGAPGARLIDRCVAPQTLLESDHKELDAEYYISKNLIPPLERIFNLVGANVRGWYDEMPKVQRIHRVDANLQLQSHGQNQTTDLAISKRTLESYMKSSSCLVCQDKLDADSGSPVCEKCLADKPKSLLELRSKLNSEERRFMDVQRICQECSRVAPLEEVRCNSLDCAVYYTRVTQKAKLRMEKVMVEPVMKELEGKNSDMNLSNLEW